MKRLYWCIALLFPVTVVAQTANDSLRREVTIEKNFTPIVRDATKINTLPEVEELTVTKQSITYSDWVAPAMVAPSVTWAPPVGFSGNLAADKRGYLDFGIGNYWNIVGNVGYRILQNEKDLLGVWAQHRSINGTVDYNQILPDYPRERAMRQLSDQVVADYAHSFKNLDLGFQGGYRYDSFNYYGLRSSLLTTPYTIGQDAHSCFLKGDVVSTKPNAQLDYRASVAYYRMGFQRGALQGEPGVAENEWYADLTLKAPMDSAQAITIDGALTVLNYTQKQAPSTTYAMLTLSPRYSWRNERVAVSAGVRADISIKEGTIFRFAPVVDFDWAITRGLDFYTTVTGGKTLNTWRRVSGYTLYFNPLQRIVNSYTPVDVSLGVRTNLLPGFSLGISGGYDWIVNALFALPGEVNGLMTGFTQMTGIDAHAVKASAEVAYRYGTLVDVEASLDYCYSMTQKGNHAISYDRPRWAGSFVAHCRPINPLSVEAGYKFALGRDYGSLGKLKDMHQVHLKASYQFTPSLSVYALGDNLLNNKYDILYGMPLHGIRFMAGVDFRF